MTTPIALVHVVFKTHLDVGFTDFARAVIDEYRSQAIPQALTLARQLRERGGEERFLWTTGAWLIDDYLAHASPDDQARMERAIQDGDVAWHGLPFTTHSELMDPSLFRYGLSIAQRLDRRFGKRTIAAKMTDVPGHTRGIVPLLAQAGIAFLHIGVNAASTPPDVPPVFVWRDPSGAEVMVMYHKGSYGDTMVVPGLPHALAFAHTNDNAGPQTAEQVTAVYRDLRVQFPGARVIASTMDAFAEQLLTVKERLPIVHGEIGDTWIHGAGTDPQKVGHFRELLRLRREWLADGRLDPGDSRAERFSRALLMVPEHTWGMDIKTHLRDRGNFSAEQLRVARATEPFKMVEASWAEQRAYLDEAVAALEPGDLATEARRRLAQLAPARPSIEGFTSLARDAGPFETAHFTIRFSPRTGAIAYLRERASGRVWSAARRPLALLRYELFSQAEYDRFYQQYIVNKEATAAWSLPDFTKPGMAPAVERHLDLAPRPARLAHRRDDAGHAFILEVAAPADAATRYGCPATFTVEVGLPDGEPKIDITVQWFDKQACRLPEAIWLTFAPHVAEPRGWRMDKLGQAISPLEVVRDGARGLHAVGAGVSYAGDDGRLAIDTLDAPLVAPGARSLLNFTNRQPPLAQGMHFNLYNNVWGTNFPMWCEDDARFRFALRFPHQQES